jgi:hypothetical protein
MIGNGHYGTDTDLDFLPVPDPGVKNAPEIRIRIFPIGIFTPKMEGILTE